MFSTVGLDEIETSFKVTKLTQEVTACNLNFSLPPPGGCLPLGLGQIQHLAASP